MVVEAVPEANYVDVGAGITLHYHDTGHTGHTGHAGDTGDANQGTVLFIHGSGPGASGWSNFKGNYPFLNTHGYRTLVPDMFGYGYSTKPTEGTYFMKDLAAQFLAMLDALNIDKVSLVGNSMGGAVCIRFALDYPERVEKLVLMAPGGIEERDVYMGMEGIQTMIKHIAAAKEVSREGMRRTFELQLFDPSLITDQIIEERFQIAQIQPKGLLRRLVVKNQEKELSTLQVPVLCFWGVDDKFCPVSGAMKIAQQCNDSRTVMVSQCGHWLMVEHRDFFNKTTQRFLAGDLA